MKKEIYILGVGRNTALLIELVEEIGYSVGGLYHYNEARVGEQELGYEIIGSYKSLFSEGSLSGRSFALSMGDNKYRKDCFDNILQKKGNIPTLIHPKAFVSRYATLEEGTIIHVNATVQPKVKIGSNSVISSNAVIIHDTTIDKHCFIADQSTVGAYTHISEGSFLGLGVTILSDKVKEVGKWSLIGAGSVVTKNIENYQIVYGNPAKPH